MVRDAAIGIRVNAELKQAAEQAAADDRRTLASVVELALIDYLHNKGYVDANGAPIAKGKKK
ncbi:MAG: hypothetical protein K0R10_141 [Alphaproteobacteria bacterium]|jgi:hypothetical protein|nr:hypothetical protein [Alphaproteobacteria bacterium]